MAKGETRKRLPLSKGSAEEWDYLIEIAKNSSVTDVINRLEGKATDGKKWDIKEDSASFEGNTTTQLTSLDEALDFCGVDLDIWQVDRYIFNNWAGNFQIKIFFSKIQEEDSERIDTIKARLKKSIKGTKIKSQKGSGIGFVAAADFHLGADVKEMIRTPDFNLDILCKYLIEMADKINSMNYKEVHLGLLGDSIESFTGLNHMNSWQQLNEFGVSAITLCFEVFRDCLISKIKNLKSVSIVSGNHDRVTIKNELDPYGQVSAMLAYLLKMEFKDLEINYNPLVVTKVIDGIAYIITHGHHRLASKELSKILYDYGKQGIYNVLLKGHYHTRQVKKSKRMKMVKYEDSQVVDIDEKDYRSITVPPIFTGNFYSESLGFSSSAGFTIIENNGKGKINHFDYCL